MAEVSVWFRAAIGRRKNAEARWLLPMICRRGGIDKRDIGAIKIMDTTTEFEISKRVADSFAAKIKRPDKEDSIRIEPLAGASQRQAPPEGHSYVRPAHKDDGDHRERQDRRIREGEGSKPRSKPHGGRGPKFDDARSFAKKRTHKKKPGHAEPSVTPWPLKGAPEKNAKKKRRG
jgi:ATP-dependent RNA helicase DeaD